MVRVYIFRRKIGAPTPHGSFAGHVGWAFELPDGGFFCGATENFALKPWHPAGDDNSAWTKEMPDEESMLEEMRQLKYIDYKVLHLIAGLTDQARAVAENNKKIGYSFSGNNCVDHTYQVLLQFGAVILPIPLECPYPNAWFSAIAAEWHEL